MNVTWLVLRSGFNMLALLLALGLPTRAQDLNVFPSSPEQLIAVKERILLFIDLGQHSKALQLLNPLLANSPADAELLAFLGRIELAKGNLLVAESQYLKSLKIAPRSVHSYLALGMLYGRKGDFKRALLMFNHAIEIDPSNSEAYSDRGVARGATNQIKESIRDFNRAIELNPRYADAYRNRGIAREALKDLKGACSDWLAASTLGQEDPKKWYDRQCDPKK